MSGSFLNFTESINAKDFSTSNSNGSASVVETERRADVEFKIATKPSSFIKAIDSTIKSFPTYLSDFAQPESGNNAGYFGWFVSVSDDGHTILVSDYSADGNSLTENGALWCFEYSGGSWSQKGSTIYGPVASGHLGEVLHLSGDGNTIYAGSNRNELTALYIYTYDNSTSNWNTAQTISGTWKGQIRSNYDGTIFIASQPEYYLPTSEEGRAIIYEYSDGSWSQKGSEIIGEQSGSLLHGVAMTPDGTKIAISERRRGRFKVFTYNTSTSDWDQKGSTLREFDNGDETRSIDLSDDANTLAVGAYDDDTNGLDGNGSIKIYIYVTDWTLVKTISGDQSFDFIAYEAISLSGDGTTVGFSERHASSSNLARIRVFRLVNSVWTEIYTNTIDYDGSNSGITCKMSRDKSTIISHYRDTDNSNYRTLYLAHSYDNGYGYYANTDTTTPVSYKSIRLMPSSNPKSGYLDLITDENENFEMKVRGNATIDTLTVNGTSTFTGELVASTATLDTLTVNRIGINKADPQHALDVVGHIRLGSTGADRLIFNNTTTGDIADVDAIVDGANGGSWGVRTKVDGGSLTEKLRINNLGAIGIAGANYGTSGQVLTSGGTSGSVSWANPSLLSYIFIRMSASQALLYDVAYNKLLLNTVVTQDPSSNITLATSPNIGRISFANAGTYKIDFMFSADADSNNRVTAIAQLRKNGTFVEPLECYAYCRNISEGENTANITAILDFSTNDYIEIWVRRNSSNGATALNKTGIAIMKIA